jgi:hypothetical protein
MTRAAPKSMPIRNRSSAAMDLATADHLVVVVKQTMESVIYGQSSTTVNSSMSIQTKSFGAALLLYIHDPTSLTF